MYNNDCYIQNQDDYIKFCYKKKKTNFIGFSKSFDFSLIYSFLKKMEK